MIQSQKNKDFIKRITDLKIYNQELHDLSKLDYVNANTNVIIIDQYGLEHYLRPGNILRRGMSFNLKSVLEKTTYFIHNANNIHKSKYTYDRFIYTNAKTKSIITCHVHGDFPQLPSKHLSGDGCPKCGGTIKSNANEFAEKAIAIHGDKHSYEFVDYVNNNTRVIINCKLHGTFPQTPGNHLQGVGCPKCCPNNIKYNNDEFIEKAIGIHGDKYGYKLVNYISSKHEIIIICKKHGKFKQISSEHLQGAGCPICSSSRGEKKILRYLEDNNIIHIHQHKFPDCKNKRALAFDFYIPHLNTCIEFDGRQHFIPISHFGGEAGLRKTIIRDNIKTTYCAINNINLIRIRYDQNSQIEDILSEQLLPLIKQG